MKRKYKSKSKIIIGIAKDRINTLFKEAKDIYKYDRELADKYIKLARKIGMKYKVRMTRQQKRNFCNHCYKFLIPGNNCRVRIARGHVIYYCLNCKKYMKIKYAGTKIRNV